MFWVFSLKYFLFFFSFSGLWNEREVGPMLVLSIRSDIQVQTFQKDAYRILISDKDMFKTHLREVYIMMILGDTDKKGQTAAAGKKWDFLDFPVGLPHLRGRKSGTSWVWKLMEVLSLFPKPQSFWILTRHSVVKVKYVEKWSCPDNVLKY